MAEILPTRMALRRLALLLVAGPMLFLVAFATLSAAFNFAGVPADRIEARVVALVPHALLFVLMCLGIGMVGMRAEVRRAWQLPVGAVLGADVAIGALSGVVLAVAYFSWLAPQVNRLQGTWGDYVPAGSILPTLTSNLAAFFIANVLLAPLIEETLYRGLALRILGDRFGTWVAGLLSCTAFGLLHWAGGIWYMLLTGAVAGGCFTALYLWRRGLVAPVSAHLSLNLIEFAYTSVRLG